MLVCKYIRVYVFLSLPCKCIYVSRSAVYTYACVCVCVCARMILNSDKLNFKSIKSMHCNHPKIVAYNFPEGPLNPEPSSKDKKKDYTWLIVVIVLLVVLFALAVLVAILVYKKHSKNKYSRKERQEQYTRSVASKVATNGAYEPDFNDIDVKFR